MNINTSNHKMFVFGIIVLAVVSRLIPHPYNFAPFGAIALFSGAYLQNRVVAVLVPCLAAWISGVILNNTLYQSMFPEFTWFDYNIFWQVLAYGLTALAGASFLNQKISATRLGLSAIGASLLFFIVSNFGYWTTGLFYARDLAGLISCYINALPFYPASLAGDLLYTTAIFGSYYLMAGRRFMPAAVTSK